MTTVVHAARGPASEGRTKPSGSARALVVGVAALLAGCAVGPTSRAPVPSLPAALHNASVATPADAHQRAVDVQDAEPSRGVARRVNGAPVGTATLAAWWTRFDDPTLVALVERAASSNLDLREAAARIAEARAGRRAAGGALAPSLGVGASYVRQRGSETSGLDGVVAGASNPTSAYQVGFDASWELDLFGGLRRGREAASADLEASQAAADAARVAVLAEVARTYIELRGFERRVAIARRNIASQAETLRLAQVRFEAGLASDFDVARAEAQLAGTRAAEPQLAAERAGAAARLAILIGGHVETVEALLAGAAGAPTGASGAATGSTGAAMATPSGAIPRAKGPEPTATPLSVIARRPDVRRSERELAAAVARVGVATADLYPRISLAAAFGFASGASGLLVDGASRRWNLIPGLQLPLFQGGRIRANIAAHEARVEAAAARHEKAVLTALAEVEEAFARQRGDAQRRTELEAAVVAAERAVVRAQDLNGRGLVDFLAVLDAERQLFALQDQLAASEALASERLVALYKALGGGWGDAT